MRVGILGPKDIVEYTHKILEEKSEENVVFRDLIYNTYKETKNLLDDFQNELDAVLFVGKVPYAYAKVKSKQLVPWNYCPRELSSFFGTYLEAVLSDREDINNLSVDTYPQDVIDEALSFIGLADQSYRIFVAEQKMLDEDYENRLINFHVHNYYSHGSACCITSLTNVYNKLREMHIPCLRSKLTDSVILTTFSHLRLSYLAKENKNSQIVVISIIIDQLNSYSVVANDEYEFVQNKMRIAELIYLFAIKIEAAVVEISNKEFLMFTTRKMLEIETNNFEKFELIQNVENRTFYTISAGIGYGLTANKAKQNAIRGMELSIKSGGNSACVVYSEKHVHKVDTKPSKTIVNYNIDKNLDEISNETGISAKILYRIYSRSENDGNGTFTVSEMAKKCNVNYRTLSRIIQKLENYGYCDIVGERIINGKGRPSRILKLNYFIK